MRHTEQKRAGEWKGEAIVMCKAKLSWLAWQKTVVIVALKSLKWERAERCLSTRVYSLTIQQLNSYWSKKNKNPPDYSKLSGYSRHSRATRYGQQQDVMQYAYRSDAVASQKSPWHNPNLHDSALVLLYTNQKSIYSTSHDVVLVKDKAIYDFQVGKVFAVLY